jgi:hypothetical protein
MSAGCPWPWFYRFNCAFGALLLSLAGCAEVSPRAEQCATSDDCVGGACVNGACVSPADASDDPTSDGAAADADADDARDVVPLSDVADAPACLEFPDSCTRNQDCCYGYCIDTDDGRVCTQLCRDDGDCAGEGWECRVLAGTAPDVVRLCVPPRDVLCQPCTNHTQCGGLNDYCLEQEDGRFCTTDCSRTRVCPDGYLCNPRVVVGGGPGGADLDVEQCEPALGLCEDAPLVCDPWTADCDGFRETGCETDLLDPQTCGVDCDTRESCADGNPCTEDLCVLGECTHPAICAGTATSCGCTTCEDCTTRDGWYDTGALYACCDGDEACAACQDQEHRAYACSGTSCTFAVTQARTLKDDCGPCGDGDSCTNDLCVDGECLNPVTCAGTSTDCGCAACVDCTASDGWYEVGAAYGCCEGSFRCVCQDRQYRTHRCNGTSCAFDVTSTDLVRSGCEACSDGDACTQDLCNSGVCAFPAHCAGTATSCGCTTCADCTASNGWYNVGAPYACCSGTSSCSSCQDQELRSYNCTGTGCTYTVIGANTLTNGCSACNDGNVCTQNQCSGAGVCSYPAHCAGTSTSCGCTTCTNCTLSSGWYNVGAAYACCNGSQRCLSCQDQQYRTYACSGTSCAYSVTSTQTLRASCSACNDSNSCTADTCVSGVCTHTPYCSGTNTSCGCTTCTNCTTLPNVGLTGCSSGSCTINSCAHGWANCDSNTGNGCERQLSGHSNSSPGEWLGEWPGDRHSGFLCPSQNAQLQATRTGTRGRFFQARAKEDSDCISYVAMSFELDNPSGVDFDLHVTGPCTCAVWDGAQWWSSCSTWRGSGAREYLVAWCDDDWGGDDSFTANIEVRYWGGVSCDPWTLRVYSRDRWPTLGNPGP